MYLNTKFKVPNAFVKINLGAFPNPANRHVQRCQLVHFLDVPHPALAVQPKDGATVAVHAQSHAGVLQALLDVMSLARASGVTDRARQGLDRGKVQALLGVQLVVQRVALTIFRLLVS
jgi:hypothetical protein